MTGAEFTAWLAKYETTQTEFANLTDTSRVQVNRWCNGHAKVPVIVDRLCGLYDSVEHWRALVEKQKDQKEKIA